MPYTFSVKSIVHDGMIPVGHAFFELSNRLLCESNGY